MLFKVGKPANAIVKDGSRQGGIGMPFAEDIDEMFRAASTAGSDDGYANRVCDRSGQVTIKAIGSAVAVHRSE